MRFILYIFKHQFVLMYPSYIVCCCSIDSTDVEVEIHGAGGGQPGAPLSSSPNAGISGMGLGNGEYDYTTALTVTLTVGVCLILLNLVVFSAIMCHRKRGFNIPVNLVDNGSRRSSHSGTPQKSTYQVCVHPSFCTLSYTCTCCGYWIFVRCSLYLHSCVSINSIFFSEWDGMCAEQITVSTRAQTSLKNYMIGSWMSVFSVHFPFSLSLCLYFRFRALCL